MTSTAGKSLPGLFNPYPNKPWFSCVSSTRLLKTLWEKEKLLVTSNFSFSHSVFYPFGELSFISFKFEIVICKLLQFGRVQNLPFGKELTRIAKSSQTESDLQSESNSTT